MVKTDTGKSVIKPNDSYIELLERCRDMALVHLSSQMDEMYNHIEPGLMDFAEKAESNLLQLRFTQAIDLLKSERDRLEKKFRRHISRGFIEFQEGSPISYPVAFTHSLTVIARVMDKKKLDRYRALQNMVVMFSSKWHRQIYALSQRLGIVRGKTMIDERDIPTNPAHTASSFQIAVKEYKFETQVLLVVYALFAKYVLGAAGTIYSDFNSRLADAGIIPNLKLSFSTSGGSEKQFYASDSTVTTVNSDFEVTDPAILGAQPSQAAPVEDMNRTLGHELFSSIQNMLTVRRAIDNNSEIS